MGVDIIVDMFGCMNQRAVSDNPVSFTEKYKVLTCDLLTTPFNSKLPNR